MPDIVGIGAINVDYIVDAKQSTWSAELARALSELVPGSERAVSDKQMEAVLAALEPHHPITSPGGSSLNTLASIAACIAEVTVGMVGIRGRSGSPALSWPTWFQSLGIDERHIAESHLLAGTCISHTSDGNRSLLTSAGANRTVIGYLGENASSILQYLSESKIVLVTSMADIEEVSPLVEILTELKRIDSTIILCFDPGALWAGQQAPIGTSSLLQLCDWVLLNQQEFDSVTDKGSSESALLAATDLLASSVADSPTIVLKRTDRIETFARHDGTTSHEQFENSTVLSPAEIVDDTGTGDAFAAGLLISLVTTGLDYRDGIELGYLLAREKLRWPGLEGLTNYSEIYRDFIH